MNSNTQRSCHIHVNFKQLVGFVVALTFLAIAPLRAADRDDRDGRGSGGDGDERQMDAILPLPTITATTVPSNGDLNPYGVAFVPEGFPASKAARPGDVLVANFNSSKNQQGTGTTIVRIPATGTPSTPASLFFQAPSGLGLTTALGIFRQGFVIVGNMPAPQGTCPGVQAGSLLILDRSGKMVAQWSDPTLLNGPWDLALHEEEGTAQVFVSNVLSGSVTRLDVSVSDKSVTLQKKTQIASGYAHRCDAAALVVGPTGLVYDEREDVLYVASTEDNAVYAVRNAGKTTKDRGTGSVIYQDSAHLHGPLGMAQAPNGHLVVSNSDVINADPNQTSELVEFTKSGDFVTELSLDPAPGGSFGLAFSRVKGDVVRLAAVDDNANNITVWSLRLP